MGDWKHFYLLLFAVYTRTYHCSRLESELLMSLSIAQQSTDEMSVKVALRSNDIILRDGRTQ